MAGLCIIILATLGIGFVMILWRLWWIWLLCLCAWLFIVAFSESSVMVFFPTLSSTQRGLTGGYYIIVVSFVYFVVVLFSTSKDVDVFIKLQGNFVKNASASEIEHYSDNYVFEWKHGHISALHVGKHRNTYAYPLIHQNIVGGFVVCNKEECFKNVADASNSLLNFVSVKRELLIDAYSELVDDTYAIHDLVWKLKENHTYTIETDDGFNLLTRKEFDQFILDFTLDFIFLLCLVLSVIIIVFFLATSAWILLSLRDELSESNPKFEKPHEFYNEL